MKGTAKHIFIAFIGIVGFVSYTTTTNTESEYRLIRDNLHVDQKGNLYLKTEDVSLAESNDPEEKKRLTETRWINVLYCDSCKMKNDNETIDGMAYLKDVIDTGSFKFIYSDHEQGADIYKDKRHSYFHKNMADGGTISVMDN